MYVTTFSTLLHAELQILDNTLPIASSTSENRVTSMTTIKMVNNGSNVESNPNSIIQYITYIIPSLILAATITIIILVLLILYCKHRIRAQVQSNECNKDCPHYETVRHITADERMQVNISYDCVNFKARIETNVNDAYVSISSPMLSNKMLSTRHSVESQIDHY